MKLVESRKRIYRILGLLILDITVIGSCINFTTIVDYFGPPSEYHYDIRDDTVLMGTLFLVIGIPLFLLFVFLEKRETRKLAEQQSKNRVNSSP